MSASSATTRERTIDRHCMDDLVWLFNSLFSNENTLLLPHADSWKQAVRTFAAEPIYLPASPDCPHHRIVFAHGFFSSALHEVAHWCIAGKKRRQQLDYGYWYEPDDRNAAKQAEFERVEVKPQAIELAFSRAARFRFRVSMDNLSGMHIDQADFERQVLARSERYEREDFPPRARRFITALENFYGE